MEDIMAQVSAKFNPDTPRPLPEKPPYSLSLWRNIGAFITIAGLGTLGLEQYFVQNLTGSYQFVLRTIRLTRWTGRLATPAGLALFLPFQIWLSDTYRSGQARQLFENLRDKSFGQMKQAKDNDKWGYLTDSDLADLVHPLVVNDDPVTFWKKHTGDALAVVLEADKIILRDKAIEHFASKPIAEAKGEIIDSLWEGRSDFIQAHMTHNRSLFLAKTFDYAEYRRRVGDRAIETLDLDKCQLAREWFVTQSLEVMLECPEHGRLGHDQATIKGLIEKEARDASTTLLGEKGFYAKHGWLPFEKDWVPADVVKFGAEVLTTIELEGAAKLPDARLLSVADRARLVDMLGRDCGEFTMNGFHEWHGEHVLPYIQPNTPAYDTLKEKFVATWFEHEYNMTPAWGLNAFGIDSEEAWKREEYIGLMRRKDVLLERCVGVQEAFDQATARLQRLNDEAATLEVPARLFKSVERIRQQLELSRKALASLPTEADLRSKQRDAVALQQKIDSTPEEPNPCGEEAALEAQKKHNEYQVTKAELAGVETEILEIGQKRDRGPQLEGEGATQATAEKFAAVGNEQKAAEAQVNGLGGKLTEFKNIQRNQKGLESAVAELSAARSMLDGELTEAKTKVTRLSGKEREIAEVETRLLRQDQKLERPRQTDDKILLLSREIESTNRELEDKKEAQSLKSKAITKHDQDTKQWARDKEEALERARQAHDAATKAAEEEAAEAAATADEVKATLLAGLKGTCLKAINEAFAGLRTE